MAWVLNRPDIVSVDSFNDPNYPQTSVVQTFTNPQNTPNIGASEIQLKRCSFTAATLQIPDYQTIFWYYRLPSATTAPSSATLKAVRLFPSTYQAPSGLAYTPTLNRPISGGADLVNLLNTATTNHGGSSMQHHKKSPRCKSALPKLPTRQHCIITPPHCFTFIRL